MWGTEYVAVPPQRHQGNVSICNRYRVIGPLDVTDRDIRSTFHRFVSICNNYELKDPGKLVEKMRLAGISQRADLAEEWRRQWYGR